MNGVLQRVVDFPAFLSRGETTQTEHEIRDITPRVSMNPDFEDLASNVEKARENLKAATKSLIDEVAAYNAEAERRGFPCLK
jgi:hypothetical protein